jgi:hypothetical protein
VTVSVSTTDPARLRLEPWGEEHEMIVGETYRVIAQGPLGGSLSVAHGADCITVTAWPGATVDVAFRKGLLQLRSGDRGRAPLAPDSLAHEEFFLAGINDVARYLKSKNDMPRREPTGLQVIRHLGKAICGIYLIWERPGTLHFRMVLPVHVPSARRERMAAHLTDINMRSSIKGFELFGDYVCFLTFVLLNRDGSVSSWVIDQALTACFNGAAHFLPELERVALGE